MPATIVSPVLVGRGRELQILTELLERTVAAGPRIALLAGEAGVGKTRLVEELAGIATRRGVRVLSGRCVQLGPEGLPLAPLVDALRSLARQAAPDELSTWLGPAQQPLARLLPALDPTGGAAGRHEASSSPQSPELSELFLGVLERVSAARPLLFVVEDLQWADQSTLDLVAYLVAVLRDVPVLLVATYRSDEISRMHPLRPLLARWERSREVHRLELARFCRPEVEAQIAAILGRPPDQEFVDVVDERSEGNAFLVEELVGLLQAGGDPDELSASLRDLLLVRVDPRSPAARQVLRAAAVAGPRVPERLLADAVGMDGPALFEALRELVEHHLMRIDEPVQGYAFRHALVRDAVYHDMLPGERANSHLRYARALAGDAGLRTDPEALAAVAHHWLAALDLPSALPALLAAARSAQAYAPAEELKHLERALEIWPRVDGAEAITGVDLPQIQSWAAEAAHRAGSLDRAESLLRQALAVGGGVDGEAPADRGDASRHALLLVQLGEVLRDLGRTAESLEVLGSAQAALPASPVGAAHAVVLNSLATAQMRAGQLEQAELTAERTVEVATAVGSQRERADALITQGVMQVYRTGEDHGLALVRAGLRLAEQMGATLILMRGHINLSDLLELLGRHAEAVEAAHAGRDLAQRFGYSRRDGVYLTGNMIEPLVRLGRWQDAERAAAEAMRLAPEGVFVATVLDSRAQLAVLSGRPDDAERLVEQARRSLGAATEPQFEQPLAFTLAEARRLRGDLEGALQVVTAALRDEAGIWSGRYSWPLVWLGSRAVADAVVAAQDRRGPAPDRAATEALAAVAAALPTLTPPTRAYAVMTGAERGRLEKGRAAERWAAAVTAWREAGEPYLLAYCLFRLGEGLIDSGDRAGAEAALREADALTAVMGPSPLAEDVQALARRARVPLGAGEASDGRTAPIDPLASFGLTEREREVLMHLANGASNGEIAAALFISPKTASVHVSNILGKLAVSRRVEAAALVHRLGAQR